MTTRGIVYLVGAGPGDPDLITVRGLQILRQAEVLVYDRLVNPELLAEAPAHAERIDAGKRPGHQMYSQVEINQLLVKRAQSGRIVVRLKGGDPFVFGRGSEEALACHEAGVPWEVVPGITSAIAAPALAGIPVTHRGIASAFAIVTAQQADWAEPPDWAALAAIDTLVVLMGVERLPHIVAALRQHGRRGDTAVALVERGSWPDERVLAGTLETIVALAAAAHVRSPAAIVIGETVSIRTTLMEVQHSAETLPQIQTLPNLRG